MATWLVLLPLGTPSVKKCSACGWDQFTRKIFLYFTKSFIEKASGSGSTSAMQYVWEAIGIFTFGFGKG